MVRKPKSLSFYMYLAFALIVMIMSWESNRAQAAVIDQTIPEQSIRLRILANSDSPMDQLVKRQIRDAIVEQMNRWVKEPQGIEAARATVREHLPELSELVGSQLKLYGYSYGYKVELGQVPFPTKMYGDKVYPAGMYEALRVTLGEGAGQNWWCVLFPPLCFIDSTSGEAVSDAKDAAKEAAVQKQAAQSGEADAVRAGENNADNPGESIQEAGQAKSADGGKSEATAEPALALASAEVGADQPMQPVEEPEVRFFFADLFAGIGDFFSSLFG